MLDAVIVGAGPIGIEMAAALKSEGLSYVHVERGCLAQTIFNYPPDTRFFSSPERIAIAGIPLLTLDQSKATREEYLKYLRSVVVQLQLNVNFSESVESISKGHGSFTVQTSHVLTGAPGRYSTRNVILAIGDMHKYRMLGVLGEEGNNVSHVMRDPHTYLGQRVLIVGGKNSAAEAAIRLYRAGAHVSLSYRNAELPSESIKYWILPELKSLINSGMIKFYPSSSVSEIGANHATLSTAQGPLSVSLDYALLLTGYIMDPSLYALCGVQTNPANDQPHWNPDTMETNIPGIFIAGTAAAGTQKPYRYFIENCHEHVERIVAAITGKPATSFRRFFELPES